MEKIISLDLGHSESGISPEEINAAARQISQLPAPFFALYSPDFTAIREAAINHSDKKNVILEGNGGSISTIRALSSCFGGDTDKNVFILDTDDPEYIAELKRKCPVEDTLFVVINRSGNSIQTISGYLLFQEYDTVFITTEGSTLDQIGKGMGVTTYLTKAEDQPVSRYSGISEFHLIPSAIIGADIERIAQGAKEMYELCAPDSPFSENIALQFALHLDKLEKLGYTEIFLSIYSKRLWGFYELIIQLYHESVCKNGKGQTVYGSDAPENQHHTLQRVNSGRRNSVAFFVTVGKYRDNSPINVPDAIKDVRCRNISVGDFGKLDAQGIIKTEFEGTWKDTIEEKIPAINLQVEEITPEAAGALIAFFQYAIYYSSILRDVNPFDQPGVERSKEYIFQLAQEKGR